MNVVQLTERGVRAVYLKNPTFGAGRSGKVDVVVSCTLEMVYEDGSIEREDHDFSRMTIQQPWSVLAATFAEINRQLDEYYEEKYYEEEP